MSDHAQRQVGVELATAANLTPARLRALEVLAADPHGHARISNVTGGKDRTVYWQTARWLVEKGLATASSEPIEFATDLYVTAEGRALAEAVR